jgi:hypothetical protein
MFFTIGRKYYENITISKGMIIELKIIINKNRWHIEDKETKRINECKDKLKASFIFLVTITIFLQQNIICSEQENGEIFWPHTHTHQHTNTYSTCESSEDGARCGIQYESMLYNFNTNIFQLKQFSSRTKVFFPSIWIINVYSILLNTKFENVICT